MMLRLAPLLLIILLCAGCVAIPDGLQPVTGIDKNRYLGRWYEIARLDHRFERELEAVTATYTLRDDGRIGVANRGFNIEDQEWETVSASAAFLDDPTVGRLKVRFFGIFYGGYNIIELDKDNYQYAMVCGDKRNVLWILARTPTLDKNTQAMLVDKAKAMGFAVNELIWVDQARNIN
jgi:apolipoprotein D and lipocalin family protein